MTTTTSNVPGVPPFNPNVDQWLRSMASTINQLIQGRMNNTGSVTLTANSATTALVLSQGQMGNNTKIKLTPKTAHAAAELATLYISSMDVDTNTITITHANNAQVDRTFDYILVG